jgi:hypothetical protein
VTVTEMGKVFDAAVLVAVLTVTTPLADVAV